MFPILTPDGDNNNALHIALKNDASFEIIDVLINAIKDQITYKQKNIQGDLPLHTALKYNATLEIITKIVNTNTDALNDKNNSGDLPLHIALNKLNINSNSELIPDTIDYLVNANPATLKIKNAKGYLPIHILSEMTADYNKTHLFTLFADEYPNSIHVDNNEGQKPYDLLQEKEKEKYRSIIGTEFGSAAQRFFARKTAKVAHTPSVNAVVQDSIPRYEAKKNNKVLSPKNSKVAPDLIARTPNKNSNSWFSLSNHKVKPAEIKFTDIETAANIETKDSETYGGKRRSRKRNQKKSKKNKKRNPRKSRRHR